MGVEQSKPILGETSHNESSNTNNTESTVKDEDALRENVNRMDPLIQKRINKGVSYNLKIVIRGKRGTGKTQLFRRLQGQNIASICATINWSHRPQDPNQSVKVEVWDVVDNGSFSQSQSMKEIIDEQIRKGSSVSGNYRLNVLDATMIDVYKNTHAVVFMVNPMDKESYDYVENSAKEVPLSMPIVILLNFKDLTSNNNDDESSQAIESPAITWLDIQQLVTSLRAYRLELKTNNLTRLSTIDLVSEGSLEKEVRGLYTRSSDATEDIHCFETSMLNCFGLKELYQYLTIPFLKLKLSVTEEQLRRCRTDYLSVEAAFTKAYQTNKLDDYDNYVKNYESKRKEKIKATTPDSSNLNEVDDKQIDKHVDKPVLKQIDKPDSKQLDQTVDQISTSTTKSDVNIKTNRQLDKPGNRVLDSDDDNDLSMIELAQKKNKVITVDSDDDEIDIKTARQVHKPLRSRRKVNPVKSTIASTSLTSTATTNTSSSLTNSIATNTSTNPTTTTSSNLTNETSSNLVITTKPIDKSDKSIDNHVDSNHSKFLDHDSDSSSKPIVRQEKKIVKNESESESDSKPISRGVKKVTKGLDSNTNKSPVVSGLKKLTKKSQVVTIDSKIHSKGGNQLNNKIDSHLDSNIDNKKESKEDSKIVSKIDAKEDTETIDNNKLYSNVDNISDSKISDSIITDIKIVNQVINDFDSQVNISLDSRLHSTIDDKSVSHIYESNNDDDSIASSDKINVYNESSNVQLNQSNDSIDSKRFYDVASNDSEDDKQQTLNQADSQDDNEIISQTSKQVDSEDDQQLDINEDKDIVGNIGKLEDSEEDREITKPFGSEDESHIVNHIDEEIVSEDDSKIVVKQIDSKEDIPIHKSNKPIISINESSKPISSKPITRRSRRVTTITTDSDDDEPKAKVIQPQIQQTRVIDEFSDMIKLDNQLDDSFFNDDSNIITSSIKKNLRSSNNNQIDVPMYRDDDINRNDYDEDIESINQSIQPVKSISNTNKSNDNTISETARLAVLQAMEQWDVNESNDNEYDNDNNNKKKSKKKNKKSKKKNYDSDI